MIDLDGIKVLAAGTFGATAHWWTDHTLSILIQLGTFIYIVLKICGWFIDRTKMKNNTAAGIGRQYYEYKKASDTGETKTD